MQHIPIGTERAQVNRAIQDKMIETEMITVKAALRNHLNREADNEDAKMCSQIISEPWDGTYRLFYAGTELGVIKHILEPERFRVEFTPAQKLN